MLFTLFSDYMKKYSKIIKYIAIFIPLALLTGFLGVAIWGSFPNLADKEKFTEAYATDNITIEDKGNYFAITPTNINNDTAIIYYPGGRVQPEAYLYKLAKIAQQTGWQIFVTKPLFNLAIFSINDADNIIKANSSIKNWYLSGHSLGGAMACQYLNDKTQTNLKGIILFGSYCSNDISQKNYKVLSISGSIDGLSTPDKVKSYEKNLPSTKSVIYISGMNHAQNGNYGKQDGDNEPTISDNEALSLIIQNILIFKATL